MGYTLQQKIDICLMAEEHPKWKQKDLAKWCQQTYHTVKKPSQTTISRILARKDQLISMKENQFKYVRKRKLTNPLLRRILQEWISQCAWNGIPVTPPIIQDTASSVWQKIPNDFRDGNGSFSYKWCTLFLSKLNLNIGKLDKELVRPGKIWTFEERHLLKTILCRIPPQDLFTLDETFLAYNLPLDVSYYEISKIKRQIDIVTVMLCCNVDGSEKLDPFIIGRYQNYQCFLEEFPNLYKNNTTSGIGNSQNQHRNNGNCASRDNGVHSSINNNSSSNGNMNGATDSNHIDTSNGLPGSITNSPGNNNPSNAPDDLYKKVSSKYGISYQSNRESFLTSTLFHEWLIEWDKKLANSRNNRKIYIILDDCCSHKIVNVKLTNITLIFTRSQSKFLPFNWGVLDEFKTKYRVQQYEALIHLQNVLTANTSARNSVHASSSNPPTGSPSGSHHSASTGTPTLDAQQTNKNINNKIILSNEQSRINICNAFKLIKRSWQSITADSIKSNWKCSGILPNDYLQLKENVSMGLRKNEFHLELLKELSQKLNVWKKWDYEILLDLNLENISANFLSLQEIITSAIVDTWEPIKRVIDLEEFDGDELAIGALDQELHEIINGVSPSINTDINFQGVHAGVTDISKSGDLTVKELIDGTEIDFGFDPHLGSNNNSNIASMIPSFDDPHGLLTNALKNSAANKRLKISNTSNTAHSATRPSTEDHSEEDEEDDFDDFDDDDESLNIGAHNNNTQPPLNSNSYIRADPAKGRGISSNANFNHSGSFDLLMNTADNTTDNSHLAEPQNSQVPSNLRPNLPDYMNPNNVNTDSSMRLSAINSEFENNFLRQQLGGVGGVGGTNYFPAQQLPQDSSNIGGMPAAPNTQISPLNMETFLAQPNQQPPFQQRMATSISESSSDHFGPSTHGSELKSSNQGPKYSASNSNVQLSAIHDSYEVNKKIANTLVTLLKHAEFGDVDFSESTLQELMKVYKNSVTKVRQGKEMFLKYDMSNQHQGVPHHQPQQPQQQQQQQQQQQYLHPNPPRNEGMQPPSFPLHQYVPKTNQNQAPNFTNAFGYQTDSQLGTNAIHQSGGNFNSQQLHPSSQTQTAFFTDQNPLIGNDFLHLNKGNHEETTRSTPNHYNNISPEHSLHTNHST